VAGSCVCGFLGVRYLVAKHTFIFAVCKGNSAGILSIEIVNETTNYRMWVRDILNFPWGGGGGEKRKEKISGGHTHSS
jgi:hypothetical protein